MGLFDKAKDLAAQHSDKISDAIERAGDLIDEKTGGQYADKVDRGQDLARERLDEFTGRDDTGTAGHPEPVAEEPAESNGPPPVS